MTEPTVFQLSSPGRHGFDVPASDVPDFALPDSFVRQDLPLPEMSELDVVRHFTHLSQKNYAIDLGFYPLGSCTMKYNPAVNEQVASLEGFTGIHPLQSAETAQGAL